MNSEEMGRIIRSRRMALGLSQADLAEMAGSTSRTVFDIERRSGNPALKTILALVNILGLDIQLSIKTPRL